MSITEDQAEQFLRTINILKEQNAKLIEYQKASFALHKKHHENLQKVVESVTALQLALNQPSNETNSINSISDLMLEDEISGFNYNELIIENKDNLEDPEIIDKLINISNSEFEQLTSEALVCLFPVFITWLSNRETVAMALVYLFEIAQSFPELFNLIEIQKLWKISLRLKTIANTELMNDSQLLGLSQNEFIELMSFVDELVK
eukprot:TRINITY_DN1417_c0_g1_i1.p1 TRINITY_DN1417_c0_g1~~TRINITY_DN1417_c0_g1_i1.p1  ORF type:complete len:205 (+),score=55.47 TRINITY_DN1417_c0_g1_i1:150-764(+)